MKLDMKFDPWKLPEKSNPWDDKDSWIKKPCMSPSHNFPSHLYIPPGQSYTYTCPGCGQSITVVQPTIIC